MTMSTSAAPTSSLSLNKSKYYWIEDFSPTAGGAGTKATSINNNDISIGGGGCDALPTF